LDGGRLQASAVYQAGKVSFVGDNTNKEYVKNIPISNEIDFNNRPKHKQASGNLLF
jgi:hypothetical protein